MFGLFFFFIISASFYVFKKWFRYLYSLFSYHRNNILQEGRVKLPIGVHSVPKISHFFFLKNLQFLTAYLSYKTIKQAIKVIMGRKPNLKSMGMVQRSTQELQKHVGKFRLPGMNLKKIKKQNTNSSTGILNQTSNRLPTEIQANTIVDNMPTIEELISNLNYN